ncbi:MAG: ribosome silencing factor [Anaerolineales bacterium]|nr:MAG: ribosome silencing factor [Anaerolineales bacterium]
MDSIELARQIVDTIVNLKGEDILLLDFREVSILTDYFIIASSLSERQARAIVGAIKQFTKKSHKLTPFCVDGDAASQWIVLDYGGVIVHILTPQMRDYYDLEGLWQEAAVVLHML